MTEIPYFDRVARGTVPLDPVGKVKGFLTAVYTHERRDPNTGVIRHVHGLAKREFEMVRDGYACGECLAYFGAPLLTCPACGMNLLEANDPTETPPDWQAWFDERNNDTTPYSLPGEIPTIDDVLRSVGVNSDVEQIRMSQLQPPKNGARRT